MNRFPFPIACHLYPLLPSHFPSFLSMYTLPCSLFLLFFPPKLSLILHLFSSPALLDSVTPPHPLLSSSSFPNYSLIPFISLPVYTPPPFPSLYISPSLLPSQTPPSSYLHTLLLSLLLSFPNSFLITLHTDFSPSQTVLDSLHFPFLPFAHSPPALTQARVLVTHSIGFLPQCDLIVSLKRGCVAEMGMYDQLMSNYGEFAEFINIYSNTENDMENEDGPGTAF